jgi:hypothetical protein
MSPTRICNFKKFSRGYTPGPPLKGDREGGAGRGGQENRGGRDGEGGVWARGEGRGGEGKGMYRSAPPPFFKS